MADTLKGTSAVQNTLLSHTEEAHPAPYAVLVSTPSEKLPAPRKRTPRAKASTRSATIPAARVRKRQSGNNVSVSDESEIKTIAPTLAATAATPAATPDSTTSPTRLAPTFNARVPSAQTSSPSAVPLSAPPGSAHHSAVEAPTAAHPSALASTSAPPVTPLEIFTRVMQGDETITDRQFDAAKVAAPYLHPKLSGLSMNAVVRKGLEDFTDDELITLAQAGQPERPD